MRIRLPAALVLLLSSIFFGSGVQPTAALSAAAQVVVHDGGQHRQATQVPLTAQASTKANPHAGFSALPSAAPPLPALPVTFGTAEHPALPTVADRLTRSARAPPASA